MIGAIIGDIIGSTYEFIDNVKDKNFELFVPYSMTTDDSIMSLAVGQALVNTYKEKDTIKIQNELIKQMQKFGRKYPYSGYGLKFKVWLREENPKPYNSFGNGSGMRVSSVAWLYNNLEDINKYAEITASVSHNHPEGIKGAEATAVAIYLAKIGKDISEIRDFITKNYYTLDFTLDEIRDTYEFNETSQNTVPQALQAFFESTNFEDAIRNAISIGGDSDTLAAICGGIAEAYYGIPDNIRKQAINFLDEDLLKILIEFENKYR